ncbi:MAG: T9SS type A sorting domain-containing protein [Ferruginibacter sp.]
MKQFTFILLLCLSLCTAGNVTAQPALNSLPSATATIYLDFNGQVVNSGYWNSGQTLNCAPSGMSDAQVTEVFKRVSEDYRPFNVNITTDETKFLAAPLNRRTRVIITPTSAWRPGVGGISYVGSFTWNDDTPAFVFCDRLGPNNSKYVAECCTHESGHTVGLSHQSTYDANCNLVDSYNLGSGSGEIAFAPVMGNSYYRNMTGWSNGPTQYGCTNTQDNLTIITSQNGFTYRTDDFTEMLGTSTTALPNNSFIQTGIISTFSDKDAFKFSMGYNGSFHFDAMPSSIGANNEGANLDILVELHNSSTALIRTYNPTNSLGVSFDTTLNAGTYYFVITGTGNANVGQYSSLGSYTITGVSGAVPIHDITLNGTTDREKHKLSWSIIADEPITKQIVEVSADGINFRPLYDAAATGKNFSYKPLLSGNIFYRLKVTSIIGETAFSNVVVLKATASSSDTYYVTTQVTSQVSVNASGNFKYRLLDVNGKMLATGNGFAGMNKIDISGKASGLYLLQLINDTQIKTERIIKQ